MNPIVSPTADPLLDPLVWWVLTPLLGAVIGSFLSMLTYRLPLIMLGQAPASDFSIAWPASHCPQCGTAIKPWHNIPVFGYLLIGGRCQACNAKIPLRYPMIELAGAILPLPLLALFGPGAHAAALALLCWLLLALTVIDLEHQLLPDVLVAPVGALGLIAAQLGLGAVSVTDALIGGVVGVVGLWGVAILIEKVLKREAMGRGDAKLLGALGAWVGVVGLPAVLFFGAWLAALVVIAARLGGIGLSAQIPFGPYLIAGGLIVIAWPSSALIFWP